MSSTESLQDMAAREARVKTADRVWDLVAQNAHPVTLKDAVRLVQQYEIWREEFIVTGRDRCEL